MKQKSITCKNHQKGIALRHQLLLSYSMEVQMDHGVPKQQQLLMLAQGIEKCNPLEAFSRCLDPQEEWKDGNLFIFSNKYYKKK